MNIMHTDNCPTQHKCDKTIWKVALFGKVNSSKIIHKLAQKFRFKLSWDGTGRLVRENIMNKMIFVLKDALTLRIDKEEIKQDLSWSG